MLTLVVRIITIFALMKYVIVNNRKHISINKGDRFGMLVYLRDAKKKRLPSGQIVRIARCKCDCGSVKNVFLLHLIRNRTMSCGCLIPRHGMRGTRLYNSWRGMRNRIRKNYFQKHLYFEKGIGMDKSWNNFSVFKKWAIKNGYKEGLTIERKNGRKGYFPNNCRWVTQEENNENRSVTMMIRIKGKKIPFTKACKIYGITNVGTIRQRIVNGWDALRALTTPTRRGNFKRRIIDGKVYPYHN